MGEQLINQGHEEIKGFGRADVKIEESRSVIFMDAMTLYMQSFHVVV